MLRKRQAIFYYSLFLLLFFCLSCSSSRKAAPPPPPPPPPSPPPAVVLYDTDGDGIADYVDKCPNLPGTIQYAGCPVPDSDGDGVNDELDRCPDRPGEAANQGCPYEAAPGMGLPDAVGAEPIGGAGNPSPPPPRYTANPSSNAANALDKASTASIAYSFKDRVPVGQSVLVQVLIQLNKPLADVDAKLQQILDEKKAVEKGRTDTSIRRTRMIAGYKTFYIQLQSDKDFFEIDSLTDGVQELSASFSTIWKWRVKGLKPTDHSEIALTIYAIDENGRKHNVDNGVLNMQVTVVPSASQASLVVPADKKEGAKKEKGDGIIFWIIGAALLALLAGLFFWMKRKKAAKAGAVYFSYAWNNDTDAEIERLYNSLKKAGYPVMRDKSNLKYKGMISGFMSEIGKAEFVLVFISDKYLKSKFCMFELYEIYRNARMNKDDFLTKIFPVRMEDVRLDDPVVVNSYIEYWEAEEAKWHEMIRLNSDNVTAEQSNQYQVLKRIITDLGTLLYLLSDINSLSKEQLFANDFAEIKSAIDNASTQT